MPPTHLLELAENLIMRRLSPQQCLDILCSSAELEPVLELKFVLYMSRRNRSQIPEYERFFRERIQVRS
jgi:hypothetical protein